MEKIDRSNTNWTPWPRLSNVPQRVQVIGGVATIIGGAYVMFRWRQAVGGKLPATVSKEWEEASEKIKQAAPMESGADPVVLNPISKHIAERAKK